MRSGCCSQKCPLRAHAEYIVIIETEFQIQTAEEEFHQTTCLGACPGPRKEVWAAQPRCPSRPTNSSSWILTPVVCKVELTHPSIATHKVNINHAFLPFHYFYWRIGVREPWVDLGHNGKFEKYVKTCFRVATREPRAARTAHFD